MKKIINHPALGGDKVDLRKPLPIAKPVQKKKELSGLELLNKACKK